jgi:hypothetical protein
LRCCEDPLNNPLHAVCHGGPPVSKRGRRGSVSRVAWNLSDDPSWTLGGGTDAFGAGVGVSLEGGNELGHLLVALYAAE